jgi:hypothetical protein
MIKVQQIPLFVGESSLTSRKKRRPQPWVTAAQVLLPLIQSAAKE